MKFVLSLLFIFLGFMAYQAMPIDSIEPDFAKKIGGVSLVSPHNEISNEWVDPVRQMNAGWVAFLPYAYSYKNKANLVFNTEKSRWGEKFYGLRELIRHAKGKGLKVMLKPMVWVEDSWPGGFSLSSEEKWNKWEWNYSKYIGELAKISQEEGVDMICIGTEFKIASQIRESYWRGLIRELRKVYDGKLTYAANWDEYQGVRFWDDLDYIGLDAYFPLSTSKTATVGSLKTRWKFLAKMIKNIHEEYDKKVLFTEFGYRSVDGCTWKQWELEEIPYNEKINMKAQINSYKAFFETFWEKDWFAGMFLWQWYHNHGDAGGEMNSDYTPQNKPVEGLISDYFSK